MREPGPIFKVKCHTLHGHHPSHDAVDKESKAVLPALLCTSLYRSLPLARSDSQFCALPHSCLRARSTTTPNNTCLEPSVHFIGFLICKRLER